MSQEISVNSTLSKVFSLSAFCFLEELYELYMLILSFISTALEIINICIKNFE